MFELFLVACVGLKVCEYLAVPQLYETEAQCAAQAALIAGMVNGRYDAGGALTWRYECDPSGETTAALAIDADEIEADRQ
jgi:hypothetical protein